MYYRLASGRRYFFLLAHFYLDRMRVSVAMFVFPAWNISIPVAPHFCNICIIFSVHNNLVLSCFVAALPPAFAVAPYIITHNHKLLAFNASTAFLASHSHFQRQRRSLFSSWNWANALMLAYSQHIHENMRKSSRNPRSLIISISHAFRMILHGFFHVSQCLLPFFEKIGCVPSNAATIATQKVHTNLSLSTLAADKTHFGVVRIYFKW